MRLICIFIFLLTPIFINTAKFSANNDNSQHINFENLSQEIFPSTHGSFAQMELNENAEKSKKKIVTSKSKKPKKSKLEKNKTTLRIMADNPNLEFTNKGKSFSFGQSEDKFHIAYSDKKLFSMCPSYIDFEDQIFSMYQPILKKDYEAFDQKMWKILSNSFFDKYPPDETTRCGGTLMFGGPGKLSMNEVKLTFQLPKHTRLKIQMTYHYIDLWDGSMGYLKYKNKKGDQNVLWMKSQNSKSMPKKGTVKVCGQHPDAHFSQSVDVTFGHTEEEITLIIGSTLQMNPADASYGVSNIQIYFL